MLIWNKGLRPLLTILILGLFLPLQGHGGVWEVLSQGAYSLTGKSCPDFNEADAKSSLCSSLSSKDQFTSLLQTLDTANQDAEKNFFTSLALEHSSQLTCASTFADQVSSKSPQGQALQKNIANKIKILNQAKRAVVQSNQELMDNKGTLNKLCPLSLADLEADYPQKEGESYIACKKVIQSRTAYQTVLSSIPLGNTPSVQELIKKSEGQDLESLERNLLQEIPKAYSLANKAIKTSNSSLKQKTSKGELNRTDKHALLSDPAIITKILKDNKNNPQVQALACRSDARYGKGAEALDTSLLVGSFALSGGVGIVGRLSASALKLVDGAAAARSAGLLSVSGMRVLQASALGVNGASTYSQIDKSCLSKPGIQYAGASSCEQEISLHTLEQDDCYLALGLSALGFAPLAKFSKGSKKVETASEDLSKVIERNSDRVSIIPPDKTKSLFGEPRYNLFKQSYYDKDSIYIGVSNGKEGSHHYYLVAGDKRYDGKPLGRSEVHKSSTASSTAEGVLFKVNVPEETLDKVKDAIEKQSRSYNISCLHGVCRVLNAADIEIPGANAVNLKLRPVLTGIIDADIKVAGKAISPQQVQMIATSRKQLEAFVTSAEDAAKNGRKYIITTAAQVAAPGVAATSLAGGVGYVVYEVLDEKFLSEEDE
ncbi:hypothetical protein D3C87_162010 [compost metagenome]